MALVLIVGLMVEVVIGRSRQLPVISSDRSWPLFDAFLVLLFFWAKRFPARNTYTHNGTKHSTGWLGHQQQKNVFLPRVWLADLLFHSATFSITLH